MRVLCCVCQVATFLAAHPGVAAVYYPGLPCHPSAHIHAEQCRRSTAAATAAAAAPCAPPAAAAAAAAATTAATAAPAPASAMTDSGASGGGISGAGIGGGMLSFQPKGGRAAALAVAASLKVYYGFSDRQI